MIYILHAISVAALSPPAVSVDSSSAGFGGLLLPVHFLLWSALLVVCAVVWIVRQSFRWWDVLCVVLGLLVPLVGPVLAIFVMYLIRRNQSGSPVKPGAQTQVPQI